MRVLIVDDDEMVRTVCSEILKVLRHDAVAVDNGEAAIRALQSPDSAFELILLDELMPRMRGSQTMQKLASLEIRIPVILCSGREMPVEQFPVAEELRPCAVLGKPLTFQSLQGAIANALAPR